MNNLELAKSLLVGEVTCVACKGETSLTSFFSGIKPIISWANSNIDLRGFAFADKVVGKAAALLMVYVGAKEVYGKVISEEGYNVLKKHGIKVSYDEIVSFIVNRSNNGECPMERAIKDINN